jgi:hypothetical protein
MRVFLVALNFVGLAWPAFSQTTVAGSITLISVRP